MFKKAIIIFLFSGLFSLVISSCCNDVYMVTSDYTIRIGTETEGWSFSPESDTIKGGFNYTLEAAVVIGALDFKQFSTIASSYAYQCPIEYENGYRRETAIVVLDKAFYIDGELVSPGTNLLEIDKDIGEDRFDTSSEEYNAYISMYEISISFKEDFVNRIRFPLDNYTITTTVELEDGTLIQSEETVAININ